MFKHYVCINYRISEKFYGGQLELLAGIGQGNVFSGNICRDTLYLIIKDLENKQLGINIKNSMTETEQKR